MKKAIILGALALFPQTSQAQLIDTVCEDTARLEKQLFGAVGADILGYGLRGPDSVIEIWVERDSRDWTLVQTYTNGTSCIMAMGEHWEVPQASDDPA
ncbi:hypothetical protein [Roseovarius phycicola]|uniref:Uncharacterized protein n=1 Tax=Roseovarius phycicola TaxID=3080976 RepID=A0ABZ2HNY9_9RHOB